MRHSDGTKDCTRCKRRLNLEQFDMDRSKGDGRRSICRDCRQAERALPRRAEKAPSRLPQEELNRDSLVLLIRRHHREFEDIRQILASQRGLPSAPISISAAGVDLV